MLILNMHDFLLSLADDTMIVCLASVIIVHLLKSVFIILFHSLYKTFLELLYFPDTTTVGKETSA